MTMVNNNMYYNFRPKSWTRRYSWVLLGASLSPISPAYWRHSISSSSFSTGRQVALVPSSSPKTRHSSRWSGSCSCTPVIAPNSSLNTWANGTESRRRSNRENLSTDPSLSGARSYESTWELRSLTPGTSNLLIPLQVRVTSLVHHISSPQRALAKYVWATEPNFSVVIRVFPVFHR